MGATRKPKKVRKVSIPVLEEEIEVEPRPKRFSTGGSLWSFSGEGSGGGSGRAYCSVCKKSYTEEFVRYGSFNPPLDIDHVCVTCIQKKQGEGATFYDYEDISGPQNTFGDYEV